MGRESEILGNREREKPRRFCWLDRDQAAASSVSFQIFQIIAVKTFQCFQTQTDALNEVLRLTHAFPYIIQCVLALTLAHFLSSKKWWCFSKVISNICVREREREK